MGRVGIGVGGVRVEGQEVEEKEEKRSSFRSLLESCRDLKVTHYSQT